MTYSTMFASNPWSRRVQPGTTVSEALKIARRRGIVPADVKVRARLFFGYDCGELITERPAHNRKLKFGETIEFVPVRPRGDAV